MKLINHLVAIEFGSPTGDGLQMCYLIPNVNRYLHIGCDYNAIIREIKNKYIDYNFKFGVIPQL